MNLKSEGILLIYTLSIFGCGFGVGGIYEALRTRKIIKEINQFRRKHE